MSKLNSTAAFAMFAKDQKVNVTPKSGGDKYVGIIKGFREDKQMFQVERQDDPETVILIPAERLKARQGRKPGQTVAKKTETQTPAKSGKVAAKAKQAEAEVEANELDADDFTTLLEALQTMKERMETNNAEVARILEENQEIEMTFGDMISGIQGHISFLSGDNEEEAEEPSDEAEEVEAPAPKKSLLKKRPMAKADADEEG